MTEYQPGWSEYLATAVVVLLLVGPVVWALTRGRRGGYVKNEDQAGGTSIQEEIRRNRTDWRG